MTIETLALKWCAWMLAIVFAGIAIEHYWPQIRDYLAGKLTRRRMAREMGWDSQWARIWRRRGM